MIAHVLADKVGFFFWGTDGNKAYCLLTFLIL